MQLPETIDIILPEEYQGRGASLGFLEKYRELESFFIRNEIRTQTIFYKSDVRGLWKFYINLKKSNSNLVWCRYPGARFWGVALAICGSGKSKKIIIEMPDPFNFDVSALRANLIKGVQGILEGALSLLTIYLIEQRVHTVVVYTDENVLVSRLLQLKKKGVLGSNPTSIRSVPAAKIGRNLQSGEHLCFVSIANFESWHGVDRILLGMYEYKKYTAAEFPIELRLIGEVPLRLLEEFKRMIALFGLHESVSLLGHMTTEEYLPWLLTSDIGLGSLGMHRTGHRFDSSLKSGLYCGIGLPFVSSLEDLRFPRDFPYRKLVAADDSPVNFIQIVDWYTNLEPDQISRAMHEYYLNSLNTDSVMAPVLSKIRPVVFP